MKSTLFARGIAVFTLLTRRQTSATASHSPSPSHPHSASASPSISMISQAWGGIGCRICTKDQASSTLDRVIRKNVACGVEFVKRLGAEKQVPATAA